MDEDSATTSSHECESKSTKSEGEEVDWRDQQLSSGSNETRPDEEAKEELKELSHPECAAALKASLISFLAKTPDWKD